MNTWLLRKTGNRGEDSFVYDMDRRKRKKLDIPYRQPKPNLRIGPPFSDGYAIVYLPIIYSRPGWIINNNDETEYRNKVKIT